MAEKDADHMLERWPGYAEQSWAQRFAELDRQHREMDKRIRKLLTAYTDRGYMIQMLVELLGPKGLEYWQHIEKAGIIRIHTSWTKEGLSLTGEERAETLLELAKAKGESIENIDGDIPRQHFKGN